MTTHTSPLPTASHDLSSRLNTLEVQLHVLRKDWDHVKANVEKRRLKRDPEDALYDALETADLENARLRLELATARHQLMQASHLPRAPGPAGHRVATRIEAATDGKAGGVDWDLNTGARIRTGFDKSIFGTLRGSRA